MATEVFLDGSDLRAKIRNPWGVLGLSFITLGIYSELRDSGALSAEEFEAEKARLLPGSAATSTTQPQEGPGQ